MTPEQIGYKGPQDFLTATDLAVERLLRESIIRQFPDDALLGRSRAVASAMTPGSWTRLMAPPTSPAAFPIFVW